MRDERTKLLNQRPWYRLLKVLSWVWLTLAFFAPMVIQESSPWVIVDGLVSVAIWTLIIYGIRRAIVYVVFGPLKLTADERKKESATSKRRMELRIYWTLSLIVFVIATAVALIGVEGILNGKEMHHWGRLALFVALSLASFYSLRRINKNLKE